MSGLSNTDQAQLYVLAAGVFLLAVFLLIVTGVVIGLVWWVVATHTHHLWIFLVAGVGWQILRMLKTLVLQKIIKEKK